MGNKVIMKNQRHNLTQSIRLQRIKTGKLFFTGDSATAQEESAEAIGESVLQRGGSKKFSGQSETLINTEKSIDNDDPTRSRLRNGNHIGRLTRHWRRLVQFWKPEPTPEQREELEKKRYMDRIRRRMTIEMRKAAHLIPQAYFNLAIQYTRTSKSKTERTKDILVHFSKCLYSDEGNTIYLKVNKVPWGIYSKKLVDDDVLTCVANSIGHPVHGLCSDKGAGTIIWVDLAGRNDFVDIVNFRDLLPKVPKDALPLTFIVGAIKNGGWKWRSLETLPHFMGAGETGGGKTNFMHSMICTFISRTTAKDVRLLMIDLKFGGVALNRYKGIPHMLQIVNEQEDENEQIKEEAEIDVPKKIKLPSVPSGIANDIPSAITVLRWAFGEAVRRGNLFLNDMKHNPQKIEEWNRWHKTKHLPRIVIFIDELSLLMDKTDTDSRMELAMIKMARSYIKSILRLARSSGVHLCGFTQSLDKSVMGVAFKTNVSGRICFSVADAPSSTLVVGDGAAVNLQPAGRAIYKRGVDKFMVQTPLMTETDIAECIRAAKSGQLLTEISGKSIAPEELIRYAVDEGNYLLNQDALRTHFKGQIAFNELVNTLREMDNNEFVVDGETYRIVPGGPRVSRRVERIIKPL
jgi:hypothetical protein